jgi:hypothetical protein
LVKSRPELLSEALNNQTHFVVLDAPIRPCLVCEYPIHAYEMQTRAVGLPFNCPFPKQ